jgi:hypothetical protein
MVAESETSTGARRAALGAFLLLDLRATLLRCALVRRSDRGFLSQPVTSCSC